MEARSDAFELKGEARDRGVETPATEEQQARRESDTRLALSRDSDTGTGVGSGFRSRYAHAPTRTRGPEWPVAEKLSGH
jgi:hypothetical protein